MDWIALLFLLLLKTCEGIRSQQNNSEVVTFPLYLAQWEDLTATSDPPLELQSHSAVISDDGTHMFVFGGQTASGMTNDFLRYNISTTGLNVN